MIMNASEFSSSISWKMLISVEAENQLNKSIIKNYCA